MTSFLPVGVNLPILQAAACGVMSIHSRSGRSVLLADLHLLLVRRQTLNRRCGALIAGVDGDIGHVVLIEECDRLDLILLAAVLTVNVCDGNRRGGLSVHILIQWLCAGYRILDDAGDRNNIQRAVSCRVANGVFTGALYIFSLSQY